MGCGASLPTAGAAEAEATTDLTPAAAKYEEKTLRKLFKSIDVDGDGNVSKSELHAKLRADSAIQDLLTKAGGSADYVRSHSATHMCPHVPLAVPTRAKSSSHCRVCTVICERCR